MTMPAAQRSAGITPAQVKHLHSIKSALRMDDAAYRTALAACGVSTCKALSYSGAAELIADFEAKAIAAGVWARRSTAAATAGAGRIGFASPAQIELIESLWTQVSEAPEEGRKAALRKFVTRQAKVSDLRFLRDVDAGKVICALKAMHRKKFQDG